MASPLKTSEETYDPKPWLEAYDAGVGSPLELQFLRLFEKNGIEVDKQVPVSAEEGGTPISVADFVVKGTKTAIYIDGAAFHRGERLRRDRFIREKLVAGGAGWKVQAFGKGDLANTSAVVAAVRQQGCVDRRGKAMGMAVATTQLTTAVGTPNDTAAGAEPAGPCVWQREA
jgi:hypothetical protein